MNNNNVDLWDGVMVELHKIKTGHDDRGVDIMHVRIDGVGPVHKMDIQAHKRQVLAKNKKKKCPLVTV